MQWDWGIADLFTIFTQAVVLGPTSYWDKQLHMSELGIHLQLKLIDPAHPFNGGRAHFSFNLPESRLVPDFGINDVDLDIIFDSYGDSYDGLFDMNMQYRLVLLILTFLTIAWAFPFEQVCHGWSVRDWLPHSV